LISLPVDLAAFAAEHKPEREVPEQEKRCVGEISERVARAVESAAVGIA
jgi:hypothetical protein